MVKLLKIGSDPEMFLFDTDTNKPVSAVGIIPGTKKNPYKISDNESVQLDNVALEFNVKPSESPNEFMESLYRCYDFINGHLSKLRNSNVISKGTTYKIIPSAEFDDDQLKSISASRFGCDPDFNAWFGSINNPPMPGGNLRTCGGHIHLGLDTSAEDYFDKERLIRLMDKNVGIYCSMICGDDKRRTMYGQAGSYRSKSYGIEYRTPSNAWISKDEHVFKVFGLVEKSIEEYNEGLDAGMEVMHAINSEEKELIRNIYNG